MEGNAFLFRVPCPNARRRILSQCLWQVDGQTMFVAKWAPEESFFYQRSRVNWLDKGDSNTGFYHRQMRTRNYMNQILYLKDEAGNLIDSKEEIMAHAISFYQDLLGGEPVSSASSLVDIEQLLSYRCSPSVSDSLSAAYTSQDIKTAFFDLPKNKAPGPDGYPSEFFTAHWSTVGQEVTDAIQEFFITGRLLQQWNATILTLIPKKKNADKISEFSPISCCNTVYKVIAKLLANRLKKVLPSVISNTQSAFIPGRLLVENVLMATELVQGYNWKNITKRSILKVDLKKAFDSINWSFIFLILRALGFPDSFINLISQCITTTRFSVAVNGELGGYFKGARGLRQGDPLSPYLYVLSMEVLGQMLNKNYSTGLIGYHPLASDPVVTHLAFADDIMIFFDGMSQMEATDLCNLGFSLGSLPVRYLGLPLMHRKLRICDYRPLIDQLKSRFTSWSSRALTFAGRKQLLSSVIFGTVNFWFSTFILPKGCIRTIESLCSRFLWNGNITTRAAAKLLWLLHTESESLWASWTKKHRLKHLSLWSIDEQKQSSWIWQSILKLRPLAERFIKCEVGNGQLASFWYDSWNHLGPLIKFFGVDGPRHIGIAINAKICEACTDTGWILRPARSPQAEELHILLCSIPLPSLSDRTDIYYWEVDGKSLTSFSAAQTWNSIRNHGDKKEWEEAIWFSGHIPSQAFHICSFSEQIWKQVTRRLGYRPFLFHTWTALLDWLHLKDRTSSLTLRRLAVHTTVSKLWFERNNRLHNSRSSTPMIIFKDIDRTIRNSIHARKRRRKFRNLMSHWLRFS
ncbi:hypothetical protein Bca101_074516 [Brassica carinata]